MEIIYAKSISEQIIDALAEAAREGRRIEKIVLTEDEFEQLKSETSQYGGVLRDRICEPGPLVFCGMYIEVEQEGQE
ncbi:MAG: hypothetical protein WC340_19150 [Kiritimatiellia bacterium]